MAKKQTKKPIKKQTKKQTKQKNKKENIMLTTTSNNNEMKKLVIFGFDGTIADTSPGILYCFNTTASAMGYQPVDHEALYGVIGIPLEEGFRKLFNMKEDEIEYAANNYSKLYSQKGKQLQIMMYFLSLQTK